MAARIVFLLPLLPASIDAQTRYPYLDSLSPLAVRRGAAAVVEVQASGNLTTANQALVEGEGIRAEVEKRDPAKKSPDGVARVRLEVSAQAALGPRDLRLVTEDAVTTVARFYVTDLPVVEEQGKAHAALAEAQEVALPCAIAGRVGGSVEVDWYRFQAKKGDRVSFNLLGARLQETIHHVGRFTPHFDAYLLLTDATGRELASADDRFLADPFLSFEVPADGAYCLAVREANYRGHGSYTYALLSTLGPFTGLTLPLALPPGEPGAVELIGPGHAPGERGEVTLSCCTPPGAKVLVRPREAGGSEAEEVQLAAAAHPVVIETEAEEGANDRPEAAQEVVLPVGVGGRIGKADAADCFAFQAVKGTAYRFEVRARGLGSVLDGELALLDAAGKAVASSDDSRDLAGRALRDPVLLWTAPADGRFVLRLADLHSRGGREFAYHLECGPAVPDFELTFDPELAMIGPGNRAPIYVRAHRRGGYTGEVALEVEGLPPGMQALAPPIREGMTDACVVLQAAADAPRGGSLLRIQGRARLKDLSGKEVEVVRQAVPLVEIYQAQRVVGRTAAAAVTSPSDIEVTTPVSEVTLRPGEVQVIPVRLVRGPRYKSGPVTLWGMWRFEGSIFGNSLPQGVTVDEGQSQTSLNGEAVEGKIALRAAPDARPVPRVQTVVIGLVPIEFSVFVPYATPPIAVTVLAKDSPVAAAP